MMRANAVSARRHESRTGRLAVSIPGILVGLGCADPRRARPSGFRMDRVRQRECPGNRQVCERSQGRRHPGGPGSNVATKASLITPHNYPFSPGPGDFPGTDQIYVGSVQTAFDDGYSHYAGRLHGPDVLTMNYSSLVPAGQTIATLTLGIAADDFQYPVWGNPFTAKLNGTTDVGLTDEINGLNETGPKVRFFTIGISPSFLLSNNVLILSIDEGGTGGDGYAIDFLTIGVTLQSVPEPSSLILLCSGAAVVAASGRRSVSARAATCEACKGIGLLMAFAGSGPLPTSRLAS